MRPTVRGFLRLPYVLLLVALGSGTCQAAHRHKPPGEPDIRSNAALVMDETSATVLLARQAQIAAPIASITKLMTALVVIDGKQPMDEMLQVGPEDCERGRGAYSRLRVGTRLNRGEMLHLALMSSENRAAHAVARPGALKCRQDSGALSRSG